MTPNQWQRVFALVKASQGRDESERFSFLAAHCDNDEEMLKAAQSLLSAQQQMGSFLETPAGSTPSANQPLGTATLTELAPFSPETLPPATQERPTLPRGANLGRYVVLDVLGTGGMGVVYAAYDPELDRKVAIKLLSPGGLERRLETDGKTRLVREAKAMARLSNSNVIAVHDVGTIGDEVFIAMEYVDGCTLKQWLDAKPRKWREIVDMFVQAGQGLLAAHLAGIVHRDFKPDNVLVGKDGRARVLDFGLARGTVPAESAQTIQIIGDGKSAQSIGPTVLAGGVTKTGTLIGTPSYMAPEQLAGGEVDARTDQFSFCVALYQTLYGELPFEGDTLRERLSAIEQGRLRLPRATANVPRWLREVVTKGLSANPDARFPSMEELLHKLQRNPTRAWTRFAAAAALVLLVSGTAWTSYRIEHNKRQICRGAEGELASVWGESQKQALSKAFLATGLPYAADAMRGVTRIFDEYGRRWIAMQTEACEATHLRGEQSGELLDLRMSCLSQRREELSALARIFASADSKTVEKAVAAGQELSAIDGCGDVEALRAPVKPPADKIARAKVEEVRLELSRVRALDGAGKYSEALPLAAQAAKNAESLAYRPLEAETLYLWGLTQRRLGDYRHSEETTVRAALSAESSRHDDIAARAFGLLIWISAVQAKYADAELWSKLALAAIERMGGNDRLLAATLINIGNTYDLRSKPEAYGYYRRALELAERTNDTRLIAVALNNGAIGLARQGRYGEAVPQFERSLALTQELVGPVHPYVGETLNNLGSLMMYSGNYERALNYYQQSLEVRKQSLGLDHPQLAITLHGMGMVLLFVSRFEEALRTFERGRAINEKAFGVNHPSIANNLTGIGSAHLGLDEPEKAIAPIERALEIYQSKEVDASWVADAQFVLARALTALKREPKRARALAEQAREAYKKGHEAREKDLARVEEWLAKNFPQ